MLAARVHRLLDGLAQHELAAHLLHRLADGGADHRLAQPLDRAAQDAGDAGSSVVASTLPVSISAQVEALTSDEDGLAEMRAPVGGRDLVLDQRVDGLGVRHPQQRLGQAHQRDALVGREAVFGEEALHQPGRRSSRAPGAPAPPRARRWRRGPARRARLRRPGAGPPRPRRAGCRRAWRRGSCRDRGHGGIRAGSLGRTRGRSYGAGNRRAG